MSDKLTYKSFIKINKDHINNIKSLIHKKDDTSEINDIILKNINKLNNTFNYWCKIINNLSNITDISMIKNILYINNYEFLKFYKKNIAEKEIETNNCDIKYLNIQKKISELLINDNYLNDWSDSVSIILLEVKLMVIKQMSITLHSELKIIENFYIINKLYYELFLYAESNINMVSKDDKEQPTVIMENIIYKTNKIIKQLEYIKELAHTFIINQGLQYIILIYYDYIQLIIKQFNIFTNKESIWVKTWNKKNQKYVILYNIKDKVFKYLFESIYISSMFFTYYDIDIIYWKEIILECEKIYKELNNSLKEKKEVAREEYLDFINKLKKKYIKEKKAKEISIKKAIEENIKQIAINESIKKELENKELIKKAALEIELKNKELIKKATLEKEAKLIELEKIKKEEEKIEKERKRKEAIERAEIKAALKLEEQKKFLLKKNKI
jgi:hypothetical protein